MIQFAEVFSDERIVVALMRQLNARRFEIGNSLNIRSDYRIHFAGANLAFMLDFWNVLNRQNPLP